MSAVPAALDLFRATAPRRAYCTDSPQQGQYINARDVALSYSHIQPNTSGLVRWLCFDVDQMDAAVRWQDKNAAPPTLVMVNPANGHAHYAYGLATPVPKTQLSRIRPLQYLAAIQEGTRRRLGADPGYSGSLIKTPGHPAWRTDSFAGVYGLSDLAEWCELPAPSELRRMAANEDYAGLGRNCTLFEHLRKQSYRLVRDYWRPGGYDDFALNILMIAEVLNVQFSNPLSYGEIKSIAKSVSNWTWQRFNPAEFRAIQSARGSRKGAAKREALLPKVRDMAERGLTQQVIADSLGIAQKTVSNWLKP